MIVVELRGGLGNQMFQYAMGLSLSLKKNQPFSLDLSWFAAHPERPYGLDHFKIRAQAADPGLCSRLTGRNLPGRVRRIHRALQKRLPYGWKSYIQEQGIAFQPEIYKSNASVYLSGYWQSELYFSEFAEQIRADFTPARALSPTAETWMQRTQAGNSVAVHIRRGDYVTHAPTSAVHGALEVRYYQRAMAEMRRTCADAKFFIFSDDPDFCQTFISGEDFGMVSGNGLENWEELIVMSACRHQIVANSSFSWWAAWLNPNEAKTVIAPNPWFRDPAKKHDDLLPVSWKRIKAD